jgi:hypothetical protein
MTQDVTQIKTFCLARKEIMPSHNINLSIRNSQWANIVASCPVCPSLYSLAFDRCRKTNHNPRSCNILSSTTEEVEIVTDSKMSRCMNLYYDTPFGKQQEDEEGGQVPDVLRWTISPLRFSQHEEKRVLSYFREERLHSPRKRLASTLPAPSSPITSNRQQRERTRYRSLTGNPTISGSSERAAERRRYATSSRHDISATRRDNRRRYSSGRRENSSYDGASWRERRQREHQQPGDDDKRKASIKIQTIVRRFLARVLFEKLSQKRDNDINASYKKDTNNVQEKAIMLMQERIQEKQRETEAEIRVMREAFDNERRAYREQMRRKIKATMRKRRDVKPQFDVKKEFQNQGIICELEEEQKQLEATRNDIRDTNAEMREEKKKLEQANDEVSKIFSSLNNFARKKAEEKKKLALVQQKLVKEQFPKARREFAQSVLACNIEIMQKEIYRRRMYKTMNAVQTTDMYDHELYEEVMDTIRSCESELGIETLDFNESFALSSEVGDMSASFLNLSSSCESDELNTTIDFETS